MMKKDNITEIQDDIQQKITGKFKKISGNTGTKPCTSQDRDKVHVKKSTNEERL